MLLTLLYSYVVLLLLQLFVSYTRSFRVINQQSLAESYGCDVVEFCDKKPQALVDLCFDIWYQGTMVPSSLNIFPLETKSDGQNV